MEYILSRERGDLLQKVISHNEEDTRELGMKLGKNLKKGDIVCLVGDLGSGKTLLSQSIAKALGVDEEVTSPTFTIIHEYMGKELPLYHFDVYRINHPDEMFEIGFEEYLFGEGICLIEWADKIEEYIPEDRIMIRIQRGQADQERIIHIEGIEI